MRYLIVVLALGLSAPALAGSRVVATCIGGASVAVTLEDEVLVARIRTRRIPLRVETHPGEEVHFIGEGFHLEVITNLDSWEVGILPGTDPNDPHAAFALLCSQGDHCSGGAAQLNCRFD